MVVKDLRINLSPKLRRIDINANPEVLATSLQGEWSSSFKGRGIEFAGFRTYQYGDDASLIDWKASLRSKEILIREFEEYKNFTVFFLFDVSDSMLFSSTDKLKCEFAAEVIYVAADAMNKAGDSIGMAMFNTGFINKVAPFVGMEVMNNMKQHLLNPKNYGGGFDFKKALLLTKSFLPGKAVVIIVSDFIGLPKGWEKYVEMLSDDFEFIAFLIRDPRDREMPDDAGQVLIKDPFTGENLYVDTATISEAYNKETKLEEERIKYVFRRAKGDFLLLETDKDYIKELVKFFQIRSKRDLVARSGN